jgi:hypothetical protein
MAKKAVIDSKLLTTIDDQIYKHLPIDKLTKIVEDKVEIAIGKLMKDNNEAKNKNQKIKETIR